MSKVEFSYADPNDPRLKRGLIKAVEAATGKLTLKRLYHDYRAHPKPGESFWRSAVRLLALDVHVDEAELERIPRQGPVVIVSNHPYGILDGVVISHLAEKVRPDFRVLAHALLLQAPETHANLLPVDFSGTPDALRTNLASRAAARQHLDEGGCVIVFPAGGISTAPDRLGRLPAIDGPWQPFTAQLVQRAKATVVPVRFAGQNSRLFQIASRFSLTIRLSLIFHEVKARIGTSLQVRVGAPIPFGDLAAIDDRQKLTDRLRLAVDSLALDEVQRDERSGARWSKLRRRPVRPAADRAA